MSYPYTRNTRIYINTQSKVKTNNCICYHFPAKLCYCIIICWQPFHLKNRFHKLISLDFCNTQPEIKSWMLFPTVANSDIFCRHWRQHLVMFCWQLFNFSHSTLPLAPCPFHRCHCPHIMHMDVKQHASLPLNDLLKAPPFRASITIKQWPLHSVCPRFLLCLAAAFCLHFCSLFHCDSF